MGFGRRRRRYSEEGHAESWFRQIYKSTFDKTLAYALRRTRTNADAYDVVADVYLVAWRRLDEFRRADDAQAWLYGVAYKTLGNHRRSGSRRDALEDKAKSQRSSPNPALNPSRVVTGRDQFERVIDALGRLPERDQEALRLAAFEGLDHRAIGHVLDIRTPLVRTVLYRARRRLERELGHSREAPPDERSRDTAWSGLERGGEQ